MKLSARAIVVVVVAAAAAASLLLAATARAGAPPPPPRVVAQDRGGKLTYAAAANGDRVVDFSTCGYMAGDEPIPDVPIRAVVTPGDGDATARIQAALDHVASLPAPADARGIRGAVLLRPGRYEIAGGLKMNASGVVLRGSGVGNTTLVATGRDRRTLITIAGKDDRKVDASPVAVTDDYVPVHATRLRVANAGNFKPGDAVVLRRPSTAEWIRAIGMQTMGGERHGFSWRPGSRDLVWDRTVTDVDGDVLTLDAPITTAIDAKYGGGTIAKYDWPGRIRQVGVENLRLESAFDAANPKDEDHAWLGVTMEHARDAWVRQVTFAHFAGGAIAVYESCRRITVEDCKSLAPVSEIGGHRRHTFFTAGQQTLFQRCYSEHGRHDFAVGFCAPGPNAFVQCEAQDALDDSGPIDSWASGVLFDNVRVDGNAIVFGDRRYQAQGAGWSAANSVLWQCHAAVIRNFAPPTANNWAIGCWATFDGDGVWQSSNDTVEPQSLYYAQLADRIGAAKADPRAQLMTIDSDPSSSPTVAEAAALVAASTQPAPQLANWIDAAATRNPIPTDVPSTGVASDVQPKPTAAAITKPGERRLAITDGVITIAGKPLRGGRQGVMWWRGTIRPPLAAATNAPSLTRFVPGRYGRGYTDDLEQLTDQMLRDGEVAVDHNYGLWYDRRRDDHERVRRMDGDVWPPFFEQPFARSGRGAAWDGLSKYDLTKYNPWYFDRLGQFAALAEAKGLVLLNHHYFQHNILEAGAHYADFPWRTANNVNDTGFPEPPPYAGDKRIFLAEQFYDLSNSNRRALHRAYIRKQLDAFAGHANVVHLTSAEFTGPLHFVQFWLDTIAEWQRETGKDVLVALSATKDVQDAILADPARAKTVDVIDIRYWWYQADGSAYAPKGGQNLAPRQHARQLKPRNTTAEQAARAVREYREKYPNKAVIFSADGAEKFGDAIREAGGSLAP